MSTEMSAIPGGWVDPLYNVHGKRDNKADRKKGLEVGKRESEISRGITQTKTKQKKKMRKRLHWQSLSTFQPSQTTN